MVSREERKVNVIAALNKARSMELHAIHQYMNQHYNLDDKDYGELAMNMKLIAIDEMRHCEMFAERIKELGGEPTSELAAKVVKGQGVKEIFGADANAEDETIYVYNKLGRTFVLCKDAGERYGSLAVKYVLRDFGIRETGITACTDLNVSIAHLEILAH